MQSEAKRKQPVRAIAAALAMQASWAFPRPTILLYRTMAPQRKAKLAGLIPQPCVNDVIANMEDPPADAAETDLLVPRREPSQRVSHHIAIPGLAQLLRVVAPPLRNASRWRRQIGLRRRFERSNSKKKAARKVTFEEPLRSEPRCLGVKIHMCWGRGINEIVGTVEEDFMSFHRLGGVDVFLHGPQTTSTGPTGTWALLGKS